MEIAFIRLNKRRVKVSITRDDGAVLETTSPGAADRVPHDLIHYVVESQLQFDDGFWGRVASGATFSSMRVIEPAKRRLPRAQRVPRPDPKRKGVHEAEVLVGLLYDIWNGTAEREWGSTRRFLDNVHSPRTRSRADELDMNAIQRVCEALDRICSEWKDVPTGGELRVMWTARN
jgi:hypothetical protein